MHFYELLKEKKQEITDSWIESVFKTYPLDTVGFMRTQKDQFTNPVGHRTTEALRIIVEALFEDGLESETVLGPLDDIIRIRSVQEFTPAKAVGFIYLLKGLIRKLVEKEVQDNAFALELLQFESKLDSLALISFDIYVKCREQIFKMRVDEVKHGQANLLRRAKLICESPAEENESNNQ